MITGEHETVLDKPNVLILARELRESVQGRTAEQAARAH